MYLLPHIVIYWPYLFFQQTVGSSSNISSWSDIFETDDGMIIEGNKKLKGADFKTYGDHRMAMSLSILSQMAEGKSTIDDSECAVVSYPDFFDDLYSLDVK